MNIEKLKEYREKFGEGFPTYQLARGKSEEEINAIIDHCISAQKNVYDLGILPDPGEKFVFY